MLVFGLLVEREREREREREGVKEGEGGEALTSHSQLPSYWRLS